MRHGFKPKLIGSFPVRVGYSRRAKKLMKKLLGRMGGQGARGEKNSMNWLHPRMSLSYPKLGARVTRMVMLGVSPKNKGHLTFIAVRETGYDMDAGRSQSGSASSTESAN